MSLKIDRVQLEIVIQQDSARQKMIELEENMRSANKTLNSLKKKFGENSAEYKVQKEVVNALKTEYDKLFEKMSGITLPSLPKIRPITLESRFSDLGEAGFLGKILHAAVLGVADGQMKRAKKLPEGSERDNKIKGALFLKRILESNSLISMSMSAGKSFPYNVAQGFMYLSNGKIFKGIRCFCTKIKVSALPKDREEK